MKIKFAGAVIYTHFFERMVNFYTRALGLTCLFEAENESGSGRMVVFDLGKNQKLFLVQEGKRRQSLSFGKTVRLLLEIDSLKKLEPKLVSLQARLVSEPQEIEGLGIVTVYQDPDGNYLQFLEPSV